MRRLPPLSAIEAFVHVAREGSIKAAAEELSLSSPALTRRIQTLERFIGRRLFDRQHQAIRLNADGERFLAGVAPALDQLGIAIETLTAERSLLRLRLGILPLFASQRLFPHLADLHAKHPELHIDTDTAPHILTRLGDTIDAGIALAENIDPSLYSVRLGTDRVSIIAARSMVEGPNAIQDPSELGNATVILHRDMPETFTAWKRAMGMPRLEPEAIDYSDSGPLMLEAAAQGLGIAFMLESHFIDAHDQRIARLFEDLPVESPYSYWFACRPRALENPAVKTFHDWLVSANI